MKMHQPNSDDLPGSSSDRELARHWIERRDAASFRELALRHAGMVYSTCLRLLRDPSAAEDAVQDSFQALAFRLEKPPDHLAGWLHKVATNASLSHLRGEKRRSKREARFAEDRRDGETPAGDLEAGVDMPLLLARIDETLAEIPEKLRQALVLHFLESQTQEAVAHSLGISRTAVTYRLRQGLELMREALRRRGVSISTVALASFFGEKLQAGARSLGPVKAMASGALRNAAVVSAAFLGLAALSAWWLLDWNPRAGAPDEIAVVGGANSGQEDSTTVVAAPGIPGVATGDALLGSGSAPRIAGKVVHRDTREPIGCARVTLIDNPATGSGERLETVLTREDGQFEFREPLPESVELVVPVVEKDGFVNWGTWYRTLDPRRPRHLDIQLQPGTLVEGKVVLPGGLTRGGFLYSICDLKDGKSQYVGTFVFLPTPVEADGRFRVWVHGQRAAFLATVPGFAPAFSPPVNLTDSGREPLKMELRPGLSVEGTVRDADGQPVGGAKVELASLGKIPWHFEWVWRYSRSVLQVGVGWDVHADTEGKFRLDGVPPTAGLLVSHRSYLPQSIEVDTTSIQFVLERARWLTFRLKLPADTSGRPPLPELHVPDEGVKRLYRTGDLVRSGPLGTGAGRATLLVEGFAPFSLEWSQGQGELDLGTVTLSRGLSLTVRATDLQGRYIEGARVDLSPAVRGPTTVHREIRGLTSPEGAWTAQGLELFEMRLTVQKEGFLPHDEVVAVESEGNPIVQVRLETGAALTGQVIDSEGNPIPGLSSRLLDPSSGDPGPWFFWGLSGGIQGHTSTYDRGQLRMTAVPPEKPLTLALRARGFVPVLTAVEAIAAGTEKTFDTIRLERGGGIKGRVRTSAGQPIPHASVTLLFPFDNNWLENGDMGSYVADLDGRFDVTGLLPGRYSVRAVALDWVQATPLIVDIPGSETIESEVILTEAASYMGRVLYEDGKPVRRATIWIDDPRTANDINDFSGSTEQDGRFLFEGLPRTPLDLTVVYGRLPPRQVAKDLSPALFPKELRVPRGADLRIRLGGVPRGLERVRVQITPGEGRKIDDTLYHEGGELHITDLPAGPVAVEVSAQGIQQVAGQNVTLKNGETSELSCELHPSPTSSLGLFVVDSRGVPVPDASVFTQSRTDEREAGKTGPNGKLQLQWSGDPPSHLAVYREGFALLSIMNPLSDAVSGSLRLELAPESVLDVRVENEDGVPIQDGNAQISPTQYEWIPARLSSWDYLHKRIGKGGQVRFSALSAGEYRLSFGRSCDEWGKLRVSMGVLEQKQVVFRMLPAFEVAGAVLHNGSRVKGGNLDFRVADQSGIQVEVDGRGAYRAFLRLPGQYTVTYSGRGELGNCEQSFLQQIGGAQTLNFDVRTVSFRARVLGPQDEPRVYMSVQLQIEKLPDGESPARTLEGSLLNSGLQLYTDREGRLHSPYTHPGIYQWKVYDPKGADGVMGNGSVEVFEDTEEVLRVR